MTPTQAEIELGYVRPLRQYYKHSSCGTVTMTSMSLAVTFAKHPVFYRLTYCTRCRQHKSVSEFTWEPDGSIVGS